jgi:Ca2+-binding RTX toxin-like protein
VSFVDGVLVVQGTGGDDRILVDFPAGRFIEGPPLRVTLNGVAQSFEGRTFGGATMPGMPEVTRIIIRGDAGDDVILVGRMGIGAEVEGGDGDDTVVGGDGPDTIDGGAGNDRLKGRGGVDVFTPSSGGGTEIDRIRQDDVPVEQRVRLRKDGTLAILGSPTADTVLVSEFHGSPLVDLAFPSLRINYNGELVGFRLDEVKRIVVEGRNGDDGVLFTDGADAVVTSVPMTLRGGSGADYLEGGNGDDAIIGGTGNDILVGHGGDDTLVGGAGNDRLRGNNGDDVLFGGPDKDHMTGDAGDDARVSRVLSKRRGNACRSIER